VCRPSCDRGRNEHNERRGGWPDHTVSLSAVQYDAPTITSLPTQQRHDEWRNGEPDTVNLSITWRSRQQFRQLDPLRQHNRRWLALAQAAAAAVAAVAVACSRTFGGRPSSSACAEGRMEVLSTLHSQPADACMQPDLWRATFIVCLRRGTYGGTQYPS